MPVTVRVLSWNVESLGDTKAVQPGSSPPAASELINFINLVVRNQQADIVGIMELKAGQGKDVKSWLLAKLNNGVGGGVAWDGIVSSRQDGGTMEEYVVLWKAQANTLQLDPNGMPAPASLIGVLDDNALSRLYAAKNWQPGTMGPAGLNAALAAAGYAAAGKFTLRSRMAMTARPRLLPDGWHALDSMGNNPQVQWSNKVPPPASITAADSQALARLMLDVDILRFITYGDRSPFLANFLVGATPQPLAVVLLHAPGPQDKMRTDAINIIGLSRPAARAAATGNLLVMGDFNIAANQGNLTGRVYGRFTNAKNQFVFAQVTPSQTAQVFAPITGTLSAPDLLPNVKTSLVNAYLADNAPLNATLANTFDKFFFRGAAGMTQANPAAVNLVDVMSSASANHDAGIARSGLTFFRSLRGPAFLNKQNSTLQRQFTKYDKQVKSLTTQLGGIQAKIKAAGALPGNSPLIRRRNTVTADLNHATQLRSAVQIQQTALGVMLALVNNAAANSPTGVGTALTTYRFAVSDHLPIRVSLTA